MMQRWPGVRSRPSGQIGFAEIRIKTGYSGRFEGFSRIFSRTPKPDEKKAGIVRIIEMRGDPDHEIRGIPDLRKAFITTATIGQKRVFFFMLFNLIFTLSYSLFVFKHFVILRFWYTGTTDIHRPLCQVPIPRRAGQ